MRMLAAEYGADIVYTEEMIDKRCVAAGAPRCSATLEHMRRGLTHGGLECRLITSERVENDALGTTDFVDKKGSVRVACGAREPTRGSARCHNALTNVRRCQLVFRTTPLERHRVVAQLGTACAGAYLK